MKYSSAEVKSGVLIVVSLVLLLVLTFIVGRHIAGETRTWQVRFGYIAGLEKNAPVYFAGRDAGKVEDIRILSGDPRPILVTVRLSDKAVLREDTVAYIDTLGLMGEKFVEMTPGTAAAGLLEPGKEIPGVDPIPVHEMVRKMSRLTDLLDMMMADLQPLVARSNDFVQGHSEEFAKIIANLHETSANIRDLTHDLKFRPWRLVRKD